MRLLFLSFLLISTCISLKIAVYNPVFAHSHTKFMARIAEVLKEEGHDVTMVWNEIKSTEKKVPWDGNTIEIGQNAALAQTERDMNDGSGGFMKIVWTMAPSPISLMKSSENVTRVFTLQCEYILHNEKFLDDVRKAKFDIAIVEGFEFCGHGFFNMVGVKSIISMSSSTLLDHQAEIIGVPKAPSYVPGALGEFSDKMSFTERASNAVGTLIATHFFMKTLESQNEVFRRVRGEEFVDLKELVASSPFFFTNALPYMDFPHPTLHKVKEIGGINVPSPKKVDQEWDSILSRKKKNVLISFGSVAKSKNMPDHLKRNLMETVKRFPDVLFIWKYEDDDLVDLPENLHLSKWTPQTDLLGDSRLSLFVTHGGLGSTTEIAYSGTPTIVIPLFADQMRNAHVLVRQGVAVTLSKYEFADADKFSGALSQVLNDKSFKENAKKLASLVSSVPFSPKEVLVRHVEFVGKFGNLEQLDPYGRQQSFIQYFLIDVISFALILLISVVSITIWILTKLCLKFFGQKKKKID